MRLDFFNVNILHSASETLAAPLNSELERRDG